MDGSADCSRSLPGRVQLSGAGRRPVHLRPPGLEARGPRPPGHIDVRRPGCGRRDQRGGGRPSPGIARHEGGSRRGRRLRLGYQPGVLQHGLGWLQVPEQLRPGAGGRTLPVPQPVGEGLSHQGRGDTVHGCARRGRTLRPLVRRNRRKRLLGAGAVPDQTAPTPLPGSHPAAGTGRVDGRRGRRHRVLRLPAGRQRCALRLRDGPGRGAPRGHGGQLRHPRGGRTPVERVESRNPRPCHRREAHRLGPAPGQRRGPACSGGRSTHGLYHIQPPRVFQGGAPDRAPDHRLGADPGLL